MIGAVNLPATMPLHASQMYAKNIATFLQYLVKDGQINLDFTDDIISSTCVTHNGEVLNQRVKDALLVPSP
jgi:NAD(P) transhydrogenase subunit alpha